MKAGIKMTFGAALLVACCIHAQTNFPVPRAEAEFRGLINGLVPRAEAIDGNQYKFIQQTQPFGPLDLSVRNASTPEEAGALRNFYLGIVGAAARVDVVGLVNRFHCGSPCASQRIKHLVALLPTIEEAVMLFRTESSLSIVAVWPIGHRLNDYFFLGNQYSLAIASPTMGFVPSGNWRQAKEAAVLDEVGISIGSRDRLFALMDAGDLTSMIKARDGSIRAIWAGMGDNEAGLLFLADTAPMPRHGQVLPDGGEIVGLERLGDRLYFYTTT